MTTDAALPNFANPPVSEVILSVQFDALAGFDVRHFGLLWEVFKARFPKVETKPPMEQVLESFDQPVIPRLQIRFLQVPLPRLWLVSAEGTELLQVQADRFVHNWRKVAVGDAYPRYPSIKEQFADEMTAFIAWCSENKLPTPQVRQCEVTYINSIATPDASERHTRPERIVNFISSVEHPTPTAEMESVNLAAHYLLKDARRADSNKPIGRLHMEMTPAFTASDHSPMYALTLIARGVPASADVAGTLDFMDLGRRAIVETFKNITTPEMHSAWGIEK